MKVATTVTLAKLAAAVSKLTGRGQGQALPGVVAERFDPTLAAKLSKQLPKGVIVVTGTNGKTTTTKLLADMLRANGERVLTNNTGSNLKRGVTSALIKAADWRGQLKGFTVGLFEVDEASLRTVAGLLRPRHIVVLNLFRDQLDRYGELDTTAALLGEGIALTEATIYLNADDPLVASLAKYAGDQGKVSYFGIEGLPVESGIGDKLAADSERCPVCHESLDFSRRFYGHIGHYSCNNCNYKRPRPSVVVTNLEHSSLEGSDFTVAIEGKRIEVKLPLPGTYNLYNALAALSVGYGLGLKLEANLKALAAAKPAFGRVERITLDGRELYLLLIKNPAGFSQVLQTFLVKLQQPVVLMAINDLAADGRDVSWLWDVPLEVLEPAEPKIIVSGIRGADMALRLRYAGIEADTVADFEQAVHRLLQTMPPGATGYILPTYTAMLRIREVLSKLTQIPEMGE